MREDQKEELEKPKVFLYLAALMIFLALGAYALQGALFDLTRDGTTFLFALVLPVLLALFFIYCYRVPRIGHKLLGHYVATDTRSETAPGLTYNLFKSESASEEKLAQTRRKSARHLRKRLARATPRPGASQTPPGGDAPPSTPEEDDTPEEDEKPS